MPEGLQQQNESCLVSTPFPSSEIHRTLPSRSELLRSVLAADLVGFQTYDYARHFVSACTRILGLEGTPKGVEDQGRLTRVAAFPIGIDSERFIRALEVPQVQEHIRELKERFAERKVMLGVHRLDMNKGIPQKILAFEKFLEENPSWRDKVVLLHIAVPTRTAVAEGRCNPSDNQGDAAFFFLRRCCGALPSSLGRRGSRYSEDVLLRLSRQLENHHFSK